MAAVGAIVGAVGSVVQGFAGASSANYQAAVAANNAKIATQNAQYALETGNREEEAWRVKAGGLIASQEAAQAASGIDVSVGSAVDVRRGARVLEELDALTIKNNAIRRAKDFEAQSAQFSAQEGLYGMEAKNSIFEGILGGVSSLAGAASSVSGKWGSMASPVAYSPSPASPMGVPSMSGPQPGLSSPLVPRVDLSSNYSRWV
jgi:hypothetical protein